MSNPWDDLRAGLEQARDIDRAVAQYASAMARLLVGKLHKVDVILAAQLKRELRDFDMHRGTWKGR